MARFAVVLDSCALVPIILADTLLRIAEAGLYQPLWSDRIVEECVGAICSIHVNADPERVRHRFAAMNQCFPDARVPEWRALEEAIELPDPDDRHVQLPRLP